MDSGGLPEPLCVAPIASVQGTLPATTTPHHPSASQAALTCIHHHHGAAQRIHTVHVQQACREADRKRQTAGSAGCGRMG